MFGFAFVFGSRPGHDYAPNTNTNTEYDSEREAEHEPEDEYDSYVGPW